jgi:hypothetical protein
MAVRICSVPRDRAFWHPKPSTHPCAAYPIAVSSDAMAFGMRSRRSASAGSIRGAP